ncbi:MAG TPA: 6,7-dimethyl-8-ribityllumazine synthase [Humisphaera sp.]|jgi:6,7-dimethyl-8-ribityllumazine synthase|nr:6,7-dimethyl-8-ribityllumazine synthase [Humisphaera sp.]
MSTAAPTPGEFRISKNDRIAIIAARFNAMIVDELLNGCTSRLAELGASQKQIEIFRVPGAFELPIAAKVAAQSERFAAVICLGCVIRGDTPHFDYVAGECARGIQQVSIEQSLPIIFGVLTTNTEQQARDRIGGAHGHAGQRAAEAAAEMIAVLRQISGG